MGVKMGDDFAVVGLLCSAACGDGGRVEEQEMVCATPASPGGCGSRAIVCFDCIAALLHLSTGQSGTQDYETSSQEPLPRTPTCTICKCQWLLSPCASSPCGNVVPKVDPQSLCGGLQGEGRRMLMGKEMEKQNAQGSGMGCSEGWGGLLLGS